MPVEFLSNEQVARFGRFNGELSQADLERFFYLDDADRDLIAFRRGDHNRLWNTRYIDAAVSALRAAGQEISETDIARLSPLGDVYINMLGRYAFTTPTPNTLRPLREETTHPIED